MNAPAVSVILPAYNCEKHIGKAIDSLLQQTFTDFELIIINDGSNDNTESIIHSYQDKRIVYLKNPENKGLIYSLNTAIELAHGKYIARMDADDICKPERLMEQKKALDENENITAVATTIEFISDKDETTGDWELDRKTITSHQIKKQMPYENCIAHPTVMMRAEIAKELKYKPYQKNIEDYDLWLRMLSRGYVIAKINEPLLLYRVHDSSVTNLYLKKSNFFFKHFNMKRKFLAKEIFLSGRINGFILIVIVSATLDIIKGFGKAIKNLFR
jgi:glycosyltransferase involved in cell wall biosynthesis